MIDISPDLWYTIIVIPRGYGGIGRRAGFRIRWVTVQVRPLLPGLLFVFDDLDVKSKNDIYQMTCRTLQDAGVRRFVLVRGLGIPN